MTEAPIRPKTCPNGHELPTIEEQKTLYTPCTCSNGLPFGSHALGHWTIACGKCDGSVRWYEPPHNGRSWVVTSVSESSRIGISEASLRGNQGA
jgi:hypothetical protein